MRLRLLCLLRLRVDHLVFLDAVVRGPDGRDVESRGHEWVVHCDGGRDRSGGQVVVGLNMWVGDSASGLEPRMSVEGSWEALFTQMAESGIAELLLVLVD